MRGLICPGEYPPNALDSVVLEGKNSIDALFQTSGVVLLQLLPGFSGFYLAGARERANALRIVAELFRVLTRPPSGGRTFAPMIVLSLGSHFLVPVPLMSTGHAGRLRGASWL